MLTYTPIERKHMGETLFKAHLVLGDADNTPWQLDDHTFFSFILALRGQYGEYYKVFQRSTSSHLILRPLQLKYTLRQNTYSPRPRHVSDNRRTHEVRMIEGPTNRWCWSNMALATLSSQVPVSQHMLLELEVICVSLQGYLISNHCSQSVICLVLLCC